MKNPFRRREHLPRIRLNPTVHGQRPRRWRPWMTVTCWSIGGVLMVLALIGGIYYLRLRPAIEAALSARTEARALTANITNQNFTAAQQNITQLQARVDTIKRNFAATQSLKMWPVVGTQYRAGVALVGIGESSLKAARPLVDFMAHLFEPFSGQGKVSLANLTADQKGQLLAGMASQESDLRAAQVAIHEAADSYTALPTKGLIGPLKKVVVPLKDQFPLITQALDQAIPATHIIPAVLGYPTQKTYLFLLENNTELRPGGGFIGTYGLMKVNSGEIVSLKTDNSYNLDDNVKNQTPIKPPAEIAKYLKQDKWYFRDSNWSPDFPTSADQALYFYQREGGDKNVDGVIAITPTTIGALLKLVGPIKVGTEEFTADNFVDQLQKYVDLQYKSNGQKDSQRKDIIGVMTKDLVDRLMKLPVTQWKDVFLILSQQLNEKQFLMYMKDQTIQGLIVQANWGGAIDQTPNSDSVLVADANLASLKTDLVMQRTYSYSVKKTGDTATATLVVHYIHTGKFDWRTSWRITRYNTYVRVYVPAGSKLISATGAQKREMSNAAGEVTTSSELNKTVFGAYKSVEPGTTSDLTLTYTLPDAISQQIKDGTYRLAFQKEAGMSSPNINFTFQIPGWKNAVVTGLDKLEKISDSAISFSGALPQDRVVTITSRP